MISELVIETAESVGNRVAAEWPFIDAEDIRQELLAEACASPDTYNNMRADQLAATFRRRAVAYCARERADYITRSARYLYTPAEVRVLLDIWAESEDATYAMPPTRDGYLAAPDAGNIMVSLWDLDRAIEALPDTWRQIVIAKLDGAQLDKTQYRAYCRAVERMTDVLNRAVNRTGNGHEGPGARRVIPNARAYAITHDDRNGR